jgi:hypothetical protein
MVKNIILKLLVLFSLCQGNNSYLNKTHNCKRTQFQYADGDEWNIRVFSRQNCISGEQKSEQEERFWKKRTILIVLTKQLKKVKFSWNRPGHVQGVPSRLRPRIFLTSGTLRVVGRQPYVPAAFTQG